MQPQAPPRAVRTALRGVLATPGLRGARLIDGIEAVGRDLGVEPFRACLLMLSAGRRDEAGARGIIEAMEAHRDSLESRLLRDPGFSVAAADFLHASGDGGWTGTPGRPTTRGAGLEEVLESEVRRHRRTGRPVALVLLSPAASPGESGWLETTAALIGAARDVDHVARLLPGGFAAVLPCTTGEEAVRAAARLRDVAARTAGTAWSGGVAALPGTAVDAEALAEAARSALDRARRDRAAVRCAGAERRRHGRHPAAAGLAARVTAGRRVSDASVEDLSLGGVLIRSARPLVPGLRVGLEIADTAPRARRQALAARVVRSEAPEPGTTGTWRAALRFDAGAESLPALAEIVAAQRTREGRS